MTNESAQANKQQYVPRINRTPFPPRGTAPKSMQSNTVMASHFQYTDEIDYNDIQSLRAYAIRTQQYQQVEELAEDHNMQEQDDNPQDADWDPDMNL